MCILDYTTGNRKSSSDYTFNCRWNTSSTNHAYESDYDLLTTYRYDKRTYRNQRVDTLKRSNKSYNSLEIREVKEHNLKIENYDVMNLSTESLCFNKITDRYTIN